MSSSLGSKDGILIRVMRVEDYPQVKLFLGDNFYKEEPLCALSEEDPQRCYEKENDEYHISMIEQGTCLIALNEKNGGSIVGATLAGGHTPNDVEKHRQEAAALEQNTWGKIAVLLSKVELEIKLFERYGISKALYTHITSVATSMRGKGLGSRLATALMKVGRSKGYPVLFGYATSFFSARQKEQLGMECIYQLAYADYKDDKGEVVFKPAPPHTHVRVVAMKL